MYASHTLQHTILHSTTPLTIQLLSSCDPLAVAVAVAVHCLLLSGELHVKAGHPLILHNTLGTGGTAMRQSHIDR